MRAVMARRRGFKPGKSRVDSRPAHPDAHIGYFWRSAEPSSAHHSVVRANLLERYLCSGVDEVSVRCDPSDHRNGRLEILQWIRNLLRNPTRNLRKKAAPKPRRNRPHRDGKPTVPHDMSLMQGNPGAMPGFLFFCGSAIGVISPAVTNDLRTAKKAPIKRPFHISNRTT